LSNSVTRTTGFKILAENDIFIVGHVYEYAYLINKQTKEEIEVGNFYGNPYCAIISKTNDWVLIGGEHLELWVNGRMSDLSDNGLTWIVDMRQVSDSLAELLIDPFSEQAAVWRIDITTKQLNKVRDFHEYRGKEHTERFVW
jgi:hypothetical protein